MKMIVFNKTESVFDSVLKDAIIFSWLIFCMLTSKLLGGGFYSFATFTLFIVYLFGEIARASKDRKRIVTTKAEALAWANSLEDDE